MFLSSINIKNFRSIVDSGEICIDRFQALVGENNCGKSNILSAIDVFLTAGAGGVKEKDFYNTTGKIVIASTFTDLTPEERKQLRRYLLGDKLILEKHLIVAQDVKTQKAKLSTEYHGYLAQPKDWWLSTDGVIEEKNTARPNWKAIAEEKGIIEYVQAADGKVNKTSYAKGLEQLLLERDDIEYDEPTLGETQALGIQQNLLAQLPDFYLLPAITDYSDEVDKRSTTTIFRKLMGDLGDRIIKLDPRYKEIETALSTIDSLFNPKQTDDNEIKRLEIMGKIEGALRDSIKALMPSIHNVGLKVEIERTKDIFSRGIQLSVDDGVPTDVLDKGTGLQRCVVFGLLKTLIKNEQGSLITVSGQLAQAKPIILAIEEPELYIHPQLERIIFNVLKEFASTKGTYDQIIYSTHSPAFVNVWEYHKIGVVRKENIETGTQVHQCLDGVLGSEDERKGFQLLNSFGIEKNDIFFAKHIIIVEGSQDKIAIIATARSLGLFKDLPEEIEYSIVTTESKGNIPKFQKLLNAFNLPYTVLLELDGNDKTHKQNAPILAELNGNKCVEHPSKLETLGGKGSHFNNDYQAKQYFSDDKNLTEDLKQIVRDIFTPAAEK